MFRNWYKKTKEFIDRYEKYLSPFGMVIGFCFDYFTLQRIDLLMENVIILSYFVLAIFSIFYINTYKKKLFKNKFLAWLNLILPFVLQITFGGLFSAFVVFYSRSASLFVSWPFLLILFGFLIGNELFRERYARLVFHLSVLYLALFAYAIFAVPVLLERIDVEIFLLSGGASLFAILLIILLLHRIDHEALKKKKDALVFSVMGIYFLFNFLYFTNIIPPIPLAIKTAGAYHQVTREGSEYRLLFEEPKKYRFWRETAYDFHFEEGGRVYVFSSIFAPTKFKEQIFHHWMFYDEKNGTWTKRDVLSFSIVGGRGGGYRGYSYKTSMTPGKWRVDIKTDRGQALGRVNFQVVFEEKNFSLEEKINS